MKFMASGSFEKIVGKLFFLLIVVFGIFYALSPKSNIPERFQTNRAQTSTAEPDITDRPSQNDRVNQKTAAQEQANVQTPPRQVRQMAEQNSPIQLEEIKICRGIIGKQPMGSGTVFPDTTKRLYCFTAVNTANPPSKISHVWFHRTNKLAEVVLDVQQENWRTWSSKRIIPQWKGPWRVEILDDAGLLIGKAEFEVR